MSVNLHALFIEVHVSGYSAFKSIHLMDLCSGRLSFVLLCWVRSVERNLTVSSFDKICDPGVERLNAVSPYTSKLSTDHL